MSNEEKDNKKKALYYDIHIDYSDDVQKKAETAERLGWSGICVVCPFDGNFGRCLDEISSAKDSVAKTGILVGAMIGKDIKKKSREAAKKADLIFASCGDYKTTREAADCWDVDVLSIKGHQDDRTGPSRDPMHQKDSGMDHIIAELLAEKRIAIEVPFSEVLCSYGSARSKLTGKIKQNVALSRKYGIPLIMTSSAKSASEMRNPMDMLSFGRTIALSPKEAKESLTKNPISLIRKSQDRRGSDILLKGLEVVRWGKYKREEKKVAGFY